MSTTTQLPIESIGEFAVRLPEPGTVDVTIEVIGEDIGDQIQVERLPWHALIYDEAEKVLELSVGARGRNLEAVFRHEIHEPVKFWVEDEAGAVKSLSIEHEDGTQTIVHFLGHRALTTGS
ncbi:MAG TPA: DUF5335 family protein [Acidimicrobiia bacterium]|nr:DUF5335 family protein [Acidimicrobiia bacterium]